MRPCVLAMLVMFLSGGCAASGLSNPSGLSSVAAAIEAVGSTATGFKSTKSTVELNGANKDLVEAQTAMTQTQVAQAQSDRQRLAQERIVTSRLLREMSRDYNARIFLTLAEWVEAGGDPDFAFKYALARVDSDNQTQVLPQQNPAAEQSVEPLQTTAITPSRMQARAGVTAPTPVTAANSPATSDPALLAYPEMLLLP